MAEIFTAWITKYALTTGIMEVEATCSEDSPEMIGYRYAGSQYNQYAHGKDWWRTREEAVMRAKAMRMKKVAAMRKQIKKLEGIIFT